MTAFPLSDATKKIFSVALVVEDALKFAGLFLLQQLHFLSLLLIKGKVMGAMVEG